MKKRILSLAMALALCLSLAITASAEDENKAAGADAAGEAAMTDGIETAGQEQPAAPQEIKFEDVGESDWYYTYVSKVVGANLMRGMDNAHFGPTGSVTMAQVLTMASTLHAQINGLEKPESAAEGAWYEAFRGYCVEHEIIAADRFTNADMDRAATRFEMVEVFDAVADEETTAAINELADGFIPDLAEGAQYGEAVYKWYRAGLISGDSGTHNFRGGDGITRAEVSVIMCRLSKLIERELIKTTPAETTPEETTPADTTPDGATPGDTTSDDATPDGAASGETTPEGTTPEDTTPGETTPEGSTPDDAPSGETTPEGTTSGDTTPADAAPEGTAPEG